MAQWIRPLTLNYEVPNSNLILAAVVVPLDNALHPYCLVPRKGLKDVGPPWLLAYKQFISGQVKHYTLDPRLPFPDSVGGIFLVQPVYQLGIECFSQLAATMNASFEHVAYRGITLVDWHIILSCYVTLF